MTTDFQELQLFEDGLEIGDAVTIYWTNSYNYYRAPGKITKINSGSVRVDLVTAPPGYGVGQNMLSPKTSSQRWSWNNYVGPPETGNGDESVLEQSTGPIVGRCELPHSARS